MSMERDFVEWVVEGLYEGQSLDGFDLWDKLTSMGLLVAVEPDPEFVAKWGEGVAMYRLRDAVSPVQESPE